MARMACALERRSNALLLVLNTGSWAVTSSSPIGSRVRVCQSISWPSASSAMASTKSTMDESGSWLQRNGISVKSNRGIVRTSTASRPSSGIRFFTPSPGANIPSGSTSITISRPGWMTAAGISALADFDRFPSLNLVGIGAVFPGMFSTCVSRPSW